MTSANPMLVDVIERCWLGANTTDTSAPLLHSEIYTDFNDISTKSMQISSPAFNLVSAAAS